MTKKLFFILMILSNLLFGATKTTTLEVDGFGVSRYEAIQDALVEAIKQSKGVSIKSKRIFTKRLEQKSSSNNSLVKNDINLKKLSKKNIKETTDGLISEYRILNAKEVSSNEWRVKVIVKMLKYITPGINHNNRRKIAIVPFYTNSSNYNILQKKYNSSKISNMLSQALTTDITQSRRFVVIDKTYTKNVAKELDIIESKKTPFSQKVKLGQRLGADYILVGTIQNTSVTTQTTHNQLLGSSTSTNKANFIVDYRIIVVATSQIKWSDTAIAEVNLDSTSSENMILQKIIKNISNDISTKLLSNIYPIKVVTASSHQIILNQGGSLLQENDIYNVYKLGKKIYDPYTKESLGYEEIKIGQIKILKVNPKKSYAKLIEGNKHQIKKGFICRKDEVEELKHNSVDNKNWRKTNIEVQDSGGVKLPFD